MLQTITKEEIIINSALHEIIVPAAHIPAIILIHEPKDTVPCSLHWHSAVELCYSVDSRLEVTIDNKKTLLKERNVAIINSGCTHQINAVTGYTNSALSVIICYSFLQDIYPEIDTIRFKLNNNRKTLDELYYILNEIYILYSNDDDPLRYLKANELIYRLLYLLFKNFSEKKLTNSSASTRKYHERYNKILKYIEENYAEPLTLDDISSFSNISKQHISREFKKYVGTGFKQHISKLRIQNSLDDLTTTDMVLIEIAIKHGFNDSRSYINAFKECFGMTPSKYRKNFIIR